jgi:penicillin amidase
MSSRPKAGRRWRRILGRILAVFCALLVVMVLVLWVRWRAPLPQVSGTLQVAGAQAPMTLVRDAHGVPHVTAGSEQDAAFATGFLHGQDRLFQMDLMRRAASGRLSELFGSIAVEMDRRSRRLGHAQAATAGLSRLSGDGRAVLESYAAGVNAAAAAAWALPVEYALLRSHFEPWTAHDSVLAIRTMQERLVLSSREMTRYRMAEQVGVDAAVWMMDGRLHGDAVVLEEEVAEDPAAEALAYQELQARLRQEADELGLPLGMPAVGDNPAGPVAALGVGWQENGESGDTILGSNAWVLGAERTATAGPLLANDTHLAIDLPAPFYLIDLQWPQAHVAGVTVPGFPGVVIGRNSSIAWGVTILTADMVDYVVETLHPENPDLYLAAGDESGAGRAFDLREETIQVRGGDPVVEVVKSTEHGPVIDPDWRPGRVLVRAAQPPGQVGALTTVRGFDVAADFESFAAAAAFHDLPAENLVYADVAGNIGYVAAAELPVRVAHSGLLPVAGQMHHAIYDGRDDPSDRPRGLNPARGYLESANNRVMRGPRGDDWNHAWIRGDRASRARELVMARSHHDAASVRSMQADTWSRQAALLLDPLQELLAAEVWALPVEDEPARRAWEILATWDRAYSRGAAPGLFALFQSELLGQVFADDVGQALAGSAAAGLLKLLAPERFVDGQPADLEHDWWDDGSTQDQTETLESQVNQALALAWNEMERRAPGGPQAWQWPDLHRAHFRHPLGGLPVLGDLFNGPDLPVEGAGGVLLANAFSASRSFKVFAIPAMRMIADLSPDGGMRMVVPIGQSGLAASRHYQDQALMWRDGGDMEIYLPYWQAAATLELEPLP